MNGASPAPLSVARALLVVSGGPVALLVGGVVAPVSAVRRWPDRITRPRARGLAWTVTVSALLAPCLYAGLLRPWLQHWGTTRAERAATYPGDIEDPLFTTTRAVTVHASGPEVWSWLVQLGQDRGGFYSYDWLENLAGCWVHSASRVHTEWHHLKVGDPLTIFPGYATTIEAVDPPHSLVIANWGAYVVKPLTPHRSRLIARSHAVRGLPGLAYVLFIELPHAIMERKMLLGIKQRAEAVRTDPRKRRRTVGGA